MKKDKKHEDDWDDGKLGRSLEHAQPAPAEALAALDASLGMQLVSIRLPRALIGDLKEIAEHHGIAYQPMVRDLLTRFAKCEMKEILHKRLKEMERNDGDEPGPVTDFLRKRKQA